MDLLLHLIRKNEVDIFDIPIAVITDQFVEYLDMMKALNINVAGDFLVMASTLVHIKSRMLLPDYGDGNEEEEDPRMEIARPLLEYLRLKEMAGELSEREVLDRDVFARRSFDLYRTQFQEEEPLLAVSLFQLMDAFKRIVEQNLPGEPLRFRTEEWSLQEKMASIMDQIKESGAVFFRNLFQKGWTISEFIVTFLALLELVHSGLVRIFQPDLDKDIRIEARFQDKEEMENE